MKLNNEDFVMKIFSALPVLLVAGIFLGGQAMAIESPDYTVVYETDDVEYRQYEAYLVAETVVVGDVAYKASGNEGFRRLFRYITGANTANQSIAMTSPVSREVTSEKIAMTSPVARRQVGAGEAVAFMLPTEYTLDTAPQPSDDRVTLREVPARLMAVVRYSGRWTDANYMKRKNILLTALAATDTETLGEAQSALYDAPYIPPFLRRNEVMIEVRDLPTQ